MSRQSEKDGNRDWRGEEQAGDHYLPTVSLIHIPHPEIPNLYQRCFEYSEPWQWSPATELVETGQWFLVSSPASLRQGGE